MQARVTQAIEPMMAAVRLHGVVSAIHMGSVERLQDWLRKGIGMARYSCDPGFSDGGPSKGGLSFLDARQITSRAGAQIYERMRPADRMIPRCRDASASGRAHCALSRRA